LKNGLAARLRAETSALHTAAERSPFMAELLAGRLDRPAYAALLSNLLLLYQVLESALMRHAIPLRYFGLPARFWATLTPQSSP